MLMQVGMLHVQLHEQEELTPLHLCRLQPALPALGEFMNLVNMFMCKTLGPFRRQFLSDLLPRRDSSQASDSARYSTCAKASACEIYLVYPDTSVTRYFCYTVLRDLHMMGAMQDRVYILFPSWVTPVVAV